MAQRKTTHKFLSPKNDLAFRRIFGNEKYPHILISFLNNLLKLKGCERIAEVKLANPYQVPRTKDLKETILDVRCVDEAGRHFIVEMQVAPDDSFEKRVLLYNSKAYVRQLGKGEQYEELKPVYFLGIMDFSFLESKNYLSNHLILDEQTGEHKVRDFQFHFVELPKFKKTEKELKTLSDKWIYFIKHADDLGQVPGVLKKEREIEQAFEILEETNWSSKELEMYDYVWDRKQVSVGQQRFQYKKGLQRSW